MDHTTTPTGSGNDWPAALYAPSCFCAKPKILFNYQYRVGHKFQQGLKEILYLFSVVDLKVEQRFIIEKNVVRRDVFLAITDGLRKEFNLPTVAYRVLNFLNS